MGQGSRAALVRLAADTLGISHSKITLLWPDTGITPPTGPTTASRQTFLTGNALVKACQELKENLFHRAADELGSNPKNLRFDGSNIIDDESGRNLSLASIGEQFTVSGQYEPPKSFPLLEKEKSRYGSPDFQSRPTHCGYSYGTHVAVVELDENSGEVNVLTIIASHDLGKVINRGAAEGQLYGGVMQGLGYALSEQFIVEDGINLTDSLKKCGVPLADTTPDIIPVFVEVPHQEGPLGAKGFAEAPSLPTAPAITNAIRDALGVRITSLPVSKEMILLERKNEAE
jgi:CO/xanthine dehydrogenase Mo-binding subunit